MKTCVHCGAEIGDQAQFCQLCGVSQTTPQTTGTPLAIPNQSLMVPKTVFYVLMVALALMGLAVIGLAVRGPTVKVQTQTNYITQMQFTTYSAAYTYTQTQIQPYTVTMASYTTPASGSGPPPSWFNGQYCGYPFNPYLCNEGPPVTVNGYLTTDGTCVDLSIVGGQTYVVWNLPRKYTNSTSPYINTAVQVYGFVYPNWPPTQPFPPYPFQTSICVGVPMWAIPPYIQAF